MGLLDLIFGKAKPKYPRVTNDMLQPVDAILSTTDAKRIIKAFYLQIGYCEDKSDASYEAECLADSIRDHEESLRDDIKDAETEYKQAITEWKEELADLENDLADADPADREETQADIAAHKKNKPSGPDIIEAKQALATFKADKRAFLIAYINEQLHGSEA